MGWFNDQTWGCGHCHNRHWLGCQRAAWEEKIPFFFCFCFTLGCRQLQESHQFARPQSECFRLRLSSSVFVCLRPSGRWLVQNASAVSPMLCVEVLAGLRGACVLCATRRRVQNGINPVSS